MEVDKSNLILALQDLYICIHNAKALNYDGKYVQSDRKLQSALTKCQSILNGINSDVVTKNIV